MGVVNTDIDLYNETLQEESYLDTPLGGPGRLLTNTWLREWSWSPSGWMKLVPWFVPYIVEAGRNRIVLFGHFHSDVFVGMSRVDPAFLVSSCWVLPSSE